MSVRIQARTDAQTWHEAIEAEGATLPHAVRQAVRRLGLGVGRTLSSERVGDRQWRWNWSGRTVHVIVQPDRTKLGNADRKRSMVTMTLAPETVARLDERAAELGVGRGVVVDELVAGVRRR